MTLAEREEISRSLVAGHSIRSVASRLGRAPSTISREIGRNGGAQGYRANQADALAWDRARRPKECKLVRNRELARVVASKLQLGGNAPFIVFDDADLHEAAKALVSAKLRNSGQVCISPNRVYVQANVHDAFVQRVKALVEAIPVDQGLQDRFVVGPLINRASIEKVARLVDDSRERGAKVMLGGHPHAKGGLFYAPTILLDVADDMPIASTEVFGPIVPVYRFSTEAEVIARSNDSEYGLVAYAFTRELGRSFRLSRNLEACMVILSSGSAGTASVPFGGVKQSGYGREGSHHGIGEYVHVKYTLMSGLA